MERKTNHLSSDQSPDKITDMMEHIINRFMGGLITDIQPPNLETRMVPVKGYGAGAEWRSGFSSSEPAGDYIGDITKGTVLHYPGAGRRQAGGTDPLRGHSAITVLPLARRPGSGPAGSPFLAARLSSFPLGLPLMWGVHRQRKSDLVTKSLGISETPGGKEGLYGRPQPTGRVWGTPMDRSPRRGPVPRP